MLQLRDNILIPYCQITKQMGDGSSSFAFPAIIGIFKRRNGNQMYVNRTFGTQSRAGFINTTNASVLCIILGLEPLYSMIFIFQYDLESGC